MKLIETLKNAKAGRVASAAMLCFAVATLSSPAGAVDLAGLVNNVTTNLNSIPKLISSLAMVVGIFFGFQAFMKFKEHSNNPNQTPLKEPLMALAIAAGLLALPFILGVGVNVFGTGATTVDGTTGITIQR